jgi:hypothetical protein
MPGPLPEELVQTLAQKLRDDQLVLFAGAGLSMQAKARDGSDLRMPGWNELLAGVAARFGLVPSHYRMDRLALLDAAEIKHGRAELNEAVREIIADDKFVPDEAHEALRELPWSAVCTTNYDTLLDRCLPCLPVVTEDDFRMQMRLPRTQWRKLLKLHGSLDDPHTLTARDYKRWAERHPVAHHFVKDLLLKDTFLFVGYSLGDPHWKALLDIVEQLIGTDQKWLYALVWQASDAELEPLKAIYKINGAGLHSSGDYASAFRQLQSTLSGLSKPVMPRATDLVEFSYDRAQYAKRCVVPTATLTSVRSINGVQVSREMMFCLATSTSCRTCCCRRLHNNRSTRRWTRPIPMMVYPNWNASAAAMRANRTRNGRAASQQSS